MGAFIYRYPPTALTVQGWLADEVADNQETTYEPVTCLAYSQVHLVNRPTGRVLGNDDK
jgi:hypothetical protein